MIPDFTIDKRFEDLRGSGDVERIFYLLGVIILLFDLSPSIVLFCFLCYGMIRFVIYILKKIRLCRNCHATISTVFSVNSVVKA